MNTEQIFPKMESIYFQPNTSKQGEAFKHTVGFFKPGHFWHCCTRNISSCWSIQKTEQIYIHIYMQSMCTLNSRLCWDVLSYPWLSGNSKQYRAISTISSPDQVGTGRWQFIFMWTAKRKSCAIQNQSVFFQREWCMKNIKSHFLFLYWSCFINGQRLHIATITIRLLRLPRHICRTVPKIPRKPFCRLHHNVRGFAFCA